MPRIPPARRQRILKLAAALIAFGLAAWFILPLAFPLPDRLTENTASPVLLDRHGKPLHHLTLPDFTRRSPVALGEVPADLIACTLAAEDKRFRSHGGIDLLATARSARDALIHRRFVSGASTITQQLVKLSSPPSDSRSLPTKLREALTARHLEMRWKKDSILEAYFNHLDYGHNRIGPVEAARYYFQKPLADLSLAECALLAGLPQAPSRRDPVDHPDRALTRRSVVLERLYALGIYDASRISAARSEPLNLRPLKPKTLAPWLPSSARNSSSSAFEDGSSISHVRTTLDADLQRDLEVIVREELAPLADANLNHAAVVVIHNPTGEILALVSSGDWNDPRGGQINGALTPRSPGSALKPFTYLLSFEKLAHHPGTIVADIPTRFRTEQGLDMPQNYDRRFRGPVTIRHALACSLNVPAMRELNDVGGPKPLGDLLNQLGIKVDSPSSYGLGLTLGNAPVTLLDLTNAYATLARGGTHFPPRLFKDSTFDVGRSMFDIHPAYLIADILSDPAARAPSFDRHGPLDLPFRCAVKTGTSSDFRDNWCLGFTAEFTVGVWAGNFDNSPMKGLSGVSGAGPVFHRAMVRLHKHTRHTWLERPGNLANVRIDTRTGKSLTFRSKYSAAEILPADCLPLPAAASDYDSSGRALLDASYSEWFASTGNTRPDAFALAKDHPASDPLRILAPRPAATYLLDPELPNGGRLHLATNLPGLAQWSSDTLTLLPGDPEPVALLTPGRHTLRARDPRSGGVTALDLTVESR